MTSYAKYSNKGETPSLSTFIKELHTANEQPEERRYEAMEYVFFDVMTNFAREFLRSMDSINGTRKLFVRQVRDFRWLVAKFPYFQTYNDEGQEVDNPIIPPESYESLISVLANDDAIVERSQGKKTARIINGKEVEVDPHKMMRDAGYNIDEGLGLDLKETLKDLDLMEIVEEKHIPKKIIATSVLIGTKKVEEPRSSFLDGYTSYKPNMTIGGVF